MLKDLKERVLEANLELERKKLVIYTWGNVSGIDRESGLVVIKPSGVSYQELTTEKMVVVDLEGNIVEGELNPSSDTATSGVQKLFRDRYRGTYHSTAAVSWAQAGIGSLFGTTHADHFHEEVPCTRMMRKRWKGL